MTDRAVCLIDGRARRGGRGSCGTAAGVLARMDQMEDSARNGSREDAQAMLDQMQEMFENMRNAQEDQEKPADREMRRKPSPAAVF